MRCCNRMKYISFVVLLLFVFLVGCAQAAQKRPGESPGFTSYREVPGVTEDEIKGIEALRKQGRTFVYAMLSGPEAFEENGEIRGFAALFCEWLTKLSGIPFKPALSRWDELIAGLYLV